MTQLFEWLSASLEAHSGLAVLSSLFWGLASVFLSPCHLASIPLAVAFLRRGEDASALGISSALAAGLLASLALVGALTVAAGRIAGDLWGLGPWLAAAALLFGGLYLLGLLRIPTGLTLDQERVPRDARGALLVGLFLGVTLGPCTFAFFAPVFAVAFATGAEHFALAVSCVSAFAAGHALAVVAAGLFGLRLNDWLRGGGALARRAQSAAGILLVGSALYLVATAP